MTNTRAVTAAGACTGIVALDAVELVSAGRVWRRHAMEIPSRSDDDNDSQRSKMALYFEGLAKKRSRAAIQPTDGVVRLYTKQGYDWTRKYPLVVEALYRLRARSVLLDGEAMCFTDGMHDFDKLCSNCFDGSSHVFRLAEKRKPRVEAGLSYPVKNFRYEYRRYSP